jgi:thymidylate kinase
MQTGTGKRAFSVSFSGIDGAGKSTQIAALKERLTGRGLRVRVISFWDEVASLTGMRETAGHTLFGGDKGVGSPSRPIERRDKNVRSWPMALIRLFLYAADGLSARLVFRKACRSGVDVVIFDRWIDDELANLALVRPSNRAYVRLITSLVPRPDLSFFLDAEPSQARARKPEYPLGFLVSSRASYYRLIELVEGITVIPPGTVEEAEHFIADRVFEQEAEAMRDLAPDAATT